MHYIIEWKHGTTKRYFDVNNDLSYQVSKAKTYVDYWGANEDLNKIKETLHVHNVELYHTIEGKVVNLKTLVASEVHDTNLWRLIAFCNQNHIDIADLPKMAAKAYALRMGPDAVQVIQHGLIDMDS